MAEKDVLKTLMLHDSNVDSISNAVEKAGGCPNYFLTLPGAKELLYHMAMNNIHITAEYKAAP